MWELKIKHLISLMPYTVWFHQPDYVLPWLVCLFPVSRGLWMFSSSVFRLNQITDRESISCLWNCVALIFKELFTLLVKCEDSVKHILKSIQDKKTSSTVFFLHHSFRNILAASLALSWVICETFVLCPSWRYITRKLQRMGNTKHQTQHFCENWLLRDELIMTSNFMRKKKRQI